MVIISSPSGAGKTTLTRKIISDMEDTVLSISVTTRKKRPNEQEGLHYYFINDSAFNQMVKDGNLLESANVFGFNYGTPRDKVLENIQAGRDVIFDIDWQGTQQIINQKLNYKIFSIFILPPSRDELYNRLLNRDKNDEKIAKERMTQFNEDVLHWKDYDFAVINDDIGSCYKKIIQFIESGDNKKDPNYQKLISLHVGSLIN